MQEFQLNGKKIQFPIFMPDATRGVVRSIDSTDMTNAGIEGVIVNTYHLKQEIGVKRLKQLGGIKNFMKWPGVVISDSGGFQVLSLINDNKNGEISSEGIVYTQNDGKKVKFTPEDSIKMQFSIMPDVMITFDDCPVQGASYEQVKVSVDRTIEWAKRCKVEYENINSDNKPLLFGVIQGGDFKKERERCFDDLNEIGFDGYGFGGWPLNVKGEIDLEILSHTASLMPDDKPKYALGVGNPQAVVDCFSSGYDIFDCVLPTRDGRHGRLYLLNPNLDSGNVLFSQKVYKHAHILDKRYQSVNEPIDPECDCHTCQNYSAAYVHHLFMIKDSLAHRLSTIHNLRTYTRLIEILRNVNR